MTTIAVSPNVALHTAARLLAAFDQDFAEDDNGVGYSKSDGPFGHLLAQTPPEAWSPDVVRGAYAMLRRYRGQLAAHGIDFDAIPEPPAGEESRAVRSVDHLDDRFVLRFPYDPAMIARVKDLPGRRWNAVDKVWTSPHSQALVDFIEDQHFAVTDTARIALEQPVPTVETTPGFVEQRGPRLVIRSEYNPALIARIRELPGRRWDPNEKVWSTPLSACNGLRVIAEEYRLDWRIVDLLDVPNVPTISVLGGRFLVRIDYDRDLMLQLREIPGAMWEHSQEAWTLPLEAAIDLVEFVREHNAQVDATATDALTAAADAWTRIHASAATDAELDIPGLGGDLLPFQRAGVRYALDALGYVQTDDGTWARPVEVAV